MKKIMLLVVCTALVMTFTGCSKQDEMKCTMKSESDNATAIGVFEENKLVSYSMEYVSTYETEEELNTAYEFTKLTYETVNTMDGYEATINKDGMSIKVLVKVDLSKLTSDSIKETFGTEEVTKEVFKQYSVDEGFTCE